MTGLLTPTPVEVGVAGELVTLRFGTLTFTLEFHIALQLSASIRHHAGVAKAAMGYAGKQRRAFGVLNDLAAPVPSRKRFVERLPALLKSRSIEVTSEGGMVAIRLDRTTARVPFGDAYKIAQWIRVRGKQARNAAGELAHWADIEGVLAAGEGERVCS